MDIRIGTAGWSLSRQVADQFPPSGSALERYSTRLRASEINSTFYRSHRVDSWARWRDSVPEDFRFSVKVPKAITHEKRLVDCWSELDRFIAEVNLLGKKVAILLVQLPPKLMFDEEVATSFFREFRARSELGIVCEPRHPSWFTRDADRLLKEFHIARVAADPAICEEASVPGGWPKICYWRLHGSPVTYRSSYLDRLEFYAQQLEAQSLRADEVWCIFDNTASSAAIGDGLALMTLLNASRGSEIHETGTAVGQQT